MSLNFYPQIMAIFINDLLRYMKNSFLGVLEDNSCIFGLECKVKLSTDGKCIHHN